MYNLWMEGRKDDAEKLQIELSRCEIGFGVGGINGTKWVVAKMRRYPETSSHCRRPYPMFVDQKKQAWVVSKMELCSGIEAALCNNKSWNE